MGGLNAAVGNAVAAVEAANMQLITAAAQFVGASLSRQGESGQQLGPPLALLVGSISSAMHSVVACALCGGPQPAVLASPEYLRWSSICAIVASYASFFQDMQHLPDLASSTSTDGSQTGAQTPSSQFGDRNSSKSGSSGGSSRSSRGNGGGSNSSSNTRSTHKAAGQRSNN